MRVQASGGQGLGRRVAMRCKDAKVRGVKVLGIVLRRRRGSETPPAEEYFILDKGILGQDKLK